MQSQKLVHVWSSKTRFLEAPIPRKKWSNHKAGKCTSSSAVHAFYCIELRAVKALLGTTDSSLASNSDYWIELLYTRQLCIRFRPTRHIMLTATQCGRWLRDWAGSVKIGQFRIDIFDSLSRFYGLGSIIET